MAINSKKKGAKGELELAHKRKDYGYERRQNTRVLTDGDEAAQG